MIALVRTTVRYRDLIVSLASREMKLRYKTASLGLLWSLINPLCLTAVLTVVFTWLIPVSIKQFPLFLLCALFPWNFLQTAVATGTVTIVQSGGLIKKVAFPREAIPIAMVSVQLYHLLVAIGLLMVALMICGVRLGAGLCWLPLLIAAQTVFTLGIVCGCAAWHTYFRDVKYVVELGLLIWFYATPIFYPLHAVAEPWQRWWLLANPMAVFVTLYRQVLLGAGGVVDLGLMAYTLIVSALVGSIGFLVFRRAARWFADVV